MMEYASGGSLQWHLRKHGKLVYPDVLSVVQQIAAAISHLHDNNVIHRDLAARNILVDRVINCDGDIELICKVTDFGLSRFVGSDEYSSKTGEGPYKTMPPESFAKGVFSRASDVWAFGVLIFEILTGDLPCPHIKDPHVFSNLVRSALLPKEIPKTCPPFLASLMRACWKQAPEQRPTMQSILKAIVRERKALTNGTTSGSKTRKLLKLAEKKLQEGDIVASEELFEIVAKSKSKSSAYAEWSLEVLQIEKQRILQGCYAASDELKLFRYVDEKISFVRDRLFRLFIDTRVLNRLTASEFEMLRELWDNHCKRSFSTDHGGKRSLALRLADDCDDLAIGSSIRVLLAFCWSIRSSACPRCFFGSVTSFVVVPSVNLQKIAFRFLESLVGSRDKKKYFCEFSSDNAKVEGLIVVASVNQFKDALRDPALCETIKNTSFDLVASLDVSDRNPLRNRKTESGAAFEKMKKSLSVTVTNKAGSFDRVISFDDSDGKTVSLTNADWQPLSIATSFDEDFENLVDDHDGQYLPQVSAEPVRADDSTVELDEGGANSTNENIDCGCFGNATSEIVDVGYCATQPSQSLDGSEQGSERQLSSSIEPEQLGEKLEKLELGENGEYGIVQMADGSNELNLAIDEGAYVDLKYSDASTQTPLSKSASAIDAVLVKSKSKVKLFDVEQKQVNALREMEENRDVPIKESGTPLANKYIARLQQTRTPGRSPRTGTPKQRLHTPSLRFKSKNTDENEEPM